MEHLEGKGEEPVLAITRFQDGSPCLSRLRTTLFWPWWASFDLYWLHVGFLGPDKPSSLLTALSNCPSLLRHGLVEGEWGSLGWWPGRMIAGSEDFIPGARTRFQLSRDLAEGCRMWNTRDHTYGVLVRFFPCMVHTNSNCCDTLRYECPLSHCCHLVVCLVVLDRWFRG
jgi:hypothetical protein